MIPKLIPFILIFFSTHGFGQSQFDYSQQVDSLKSGLKSSSIKGDEVHQQLKLLVELSNLEGARGDKIKGRAYLDKALGYLDQVPNSQEKLALILRIQSVLLKVYNDFDLATVVIEDGLKSARKLNDSTNISRFYEAQAYILSGSDDQKKGYGLYQKALEFANDRPEQRAEILFRLTEMAYEMDKDEGDYYYGLVEEMRELLPMDRVYNLERIKFWQDEEYTKADSVIRENLRWNIEHNELDHAAFKYYLLIENYRMMNENQKAISAGEEGYEFTLDNGNTIERRYLVMSLIPIYDSLGDYKNAFRLLNELNEMDKIRFDTEAQDKHDQINQMVAHHKLKEGEFESKQKSLELEKSSAELEKSNQRQIFYGIALFLFLLFGLFVFRAYRRKRSDNLLISQQKAMVELKNKEITDSIQYAKRIQSAILPPIKLVKEYLKDSFVLYKPKDVVAGDFYWMEPVRDSILFAAADCTGHGVPGAMVSVICNNGLNRSVREHGLTDPGLILDKTREIVIQEFEKSEEEVKDGMDIALCCLTGNQLEYAGAHNPLWIIRDGADEIEEIKANKQPIGVFEKLDVFTTHSIQLSSGDAFYIFSDGFADQFGGKKGKKFKTANFKRLLLSIQAESMERQKEMIDEAFENWRGKVEQLDDVCVIGFQML